MALQTDVLLVTYGNRWPLLRMTVTALTQNPAVRKLTIIDNGSRYSVIEQLQTIPHPDTEIIELPENKGSAFAFYTGLTYLQNNPEVQHILLLDDDLIPQDNCIATLLAQWQTIAAEKQTDNFLLQCIRPDRAYLRSAAKGVEPEAFFPQRNHFLGFSITKILYRGARRALEQRIKSLPEQERVPIPCAPYGGLFMHKHALAHTGMPNVQLHTYADDFELTLRYTQNGGEIYLIPQAIAEDQEPTLVNNRRSGFLSSKFFDMPERRLFLLMRNTAWYTQALLCDKKMVVSPQPHTIQYVFAMQRTIAWKNEVVQNL